MNSDSSRVDWLEAQFTLHYSLEFLYVVDGIEVVRLHDGSPVTPELHGKDIREAIDLMRNHLDSSASD